MRSKIVKRNSPRRNCRQNGLDLFLANYNQTRLSKSMLGNALEALVGAVYIEVGYDQTKTFVVRLSAQVPGYSRIGKASTITIKASCWNGAKKMAGLSNTRWSPNTKAEKRDKFKVAVFVDGKKDGTADDFNKKSAGTTRQRPCDDRPGILGGNGIATPMEDEEGND